MKMLLTILSFALLASSQAQATAFSLYFAYEGSVLEEFGDAGQYPNRRQVPNYQLGISFLQADSGEAFLVVNKNGARPDNYALKRVSAGVFKLVELGDDNFNVRGEMKISLDGSKIEKIDFKTHNYDGSEAGESFRLTPNAEGGYDFYSSWSDDANSRRSGKLQER